MEGVRGEVIEKEGGGRVDGEDDDGDVLDVYWASSDRGDDGFELGSVWVEGS